MESQNYGSGGIRTHASEETGALNQRLRPLGHATCECRCSQTSQNRNKLDTITRSNMQKAASIPKSTLNEDYNLVNYMLSINRIGYFDSDVIFTETLA